MKLIKSIDFNVKEKFILFIIEKFIKGLCSLLLIFFFTKNFSKNIFGIFTYFESISIVMLGLGSLALFQIFIREFNYKKYSDSTIISTGFVLNTLACFIIIFITSILIRFNDNLEIIFYAAFSSTIISSSFLSLHAFYEKSNRIKKFLYPSILNFIIFFLFKLYSIEGIKDLNYLIGFTILENISLFIINAYLLKQAKFRFIKYFDFKLAKEFLRSSSPLILSTLAVLMIIRFDQLYIKEYLGYESNAEYSAAFKLIEYFFIIPTIYMRANFPHLNKIYKKEKVFKTEIIKTLKRISLYSLFSILTLIFFGEFILKLIFNFSFPSAQNIFLILSPVILLYSLLTLVNQIIILLKKEYLYLIRSILGMLLNIILNIFLITQYGIIGAAVSTLITYIFTAILFNYFDKDIIKIFTKRNSSNLN